MRCVWLSLPGPILVAVRTGILGGTFDPIHVAHLHTAECALHQLGLDRVLLIPAGDPWQKDDRVVSEAVHRLEMTRLAVEGVPGLEPDDREVQRKGWTYTIDTLETFPDDEELFLILGSDAASRIRTWNRWEDVLARAQLVVAPRPGSTIETDAMSIDMGLMEVSGTEIRARARTGRPFRYLVTGSVYDYIVSNSLYVDGSRRDMVGESESMENSS